MNATQLINKAKNADKLIHIPLKTTYFELGKMRQAYEAVISYREVTLYCEDIILIYDVNTICGRDSLLLIDWENVT